MTDAASPETTKAATPARRRDPAEHELHTRRRGRNLAVGGALLGMVLLLFAVTVVKMRENAGNPFSRPQVHAMPPVAPETQ